MKLSFMAAPGLASVLLAGCVIVDADVRDSGWSHGDFGSLYAAEVSPHMGEVTIVARSNGCTQKDDFRIFTHNSADDAFDVGFRRERPDNCKALVPEGRRMTWTYAELGIPRNASVHILNPVGR